MDVLLPKWGVTMQEATVDEWLVTEGQQVQEGQPIVRVGTDKVDAEVEAPASGVLRSIHVPEGEVAPVGAVLAVIDES
ncbi:MAG TPA: biotin/lipoyl-containing protein [Streptosporangiaceae bacterium]|nr:biotin/lipoyl-containing protein [Streptosporangiaceae bacterium]